MKVYQLQCVRYYKEYYDARDYIFFSKEKAYRYGRIFMRLIEGSTGSAFIKEVKLYTTDAKIYVLNEECHGQIGYFLDKDKAYEAAKDVAAENPFYDTWNEERHDWDRTEVLRESMTDEQIDNDKFGVNISDYDLDCAWCQ